MKWENLAGCFFAVGRNMSYGQPVAGDASLPEPPEFPELGEAATLPGGRDTGNSKKEDSAEFFFPPKHQITPPRN